MTDKEFKEKLKERYNDQIECLDIFISYKKTPRMKYKCKNPLHNEPFEIRTDRILRPESVGCPFCAGNAKTQLMVEHEINEKFNGNIKFNDKYIYGVSKTFDTFTFTCKKHGDFPEKLHNMLNCNYEFGCKKCAQEKISRIKNDKTIKALLEKIKNTNLMVDINTIKGVNKNATFYCKKHNCYFDRKVGKVLYSNRFKCPECLKSNGELLTEEILKEISIEYNTQEYVGDTSMKFDFFIESLNLAIEFDGKQHFDPTSMYYNEEQVKRDNLKNKYCEDNNIFLLRLQVNNTDRLDKNYLKELIENTIQKVKSSTTSKIIIINCNKEQDNDF